MPDAAQRMTCMEVWGGSDAVDAAVTLSGLDAWVYSKPFEGAQAGGDVYYVSACATGRINRLLVADVSGHGEAVREVAMDLRDLMRKNVNYLDQARFVASMNHQFVENSKAGTFATAIVTTFFAPTRTLSVCNAGHPAPLVWRAKTREWSLLERGGNIPLGIMDLDDYQQFDETLDVGDMIIVYTDSLIEATDAMGEMLGATGLLDVAKSLSTEHPARLIPELIAAVERRISGTITADDVTALLIRANGTGEKVPLKDKLLAPVRVLRGIGRAIAGKSPLALPEFTLANLGGAIIGPLSKLWHGRR
jgi:serine phosphatase RsbU (regulator of sigma subunit)